MVDVVTPEVRSRMMAGIRGRNTKPEIVVRSLLHKRGLRFRLHARDLPGKPDIVLPKYRAVVFVHGCFWHGHDCRLFKLPTTRPEFWGAKIDRNRTNDAKAVETLRSIGWRVAVIWECALRGATRDLDAVADRLEIWIRGHQDTFEERG